MDNLLSKCNLSPNRPLSVVYFSKGLSLNDVYWVVPEDFGGSFSDVNLYDNRFSRVLSYIAFTGYGSSLKSSSFSSPEFTTNGRLPKCWRRINGKIELYKGSTSGFSNAGYEAYSEFYAFQIARGMGFDAIEYNLSKWKGNLCSTCRLFTSKDYSFVPVGVLVKKGGKLLKKYDKTLQPCVYDDFIGTAKKVLTAEHKERLRKLLDFKFKKHPRYNVPESRLERINEQVRENVRELLG